jgi:2-aminoethylphosphonate-pyruvate transaminase
LIYEQRALPVVLNFPQDNVVLLSGPTYAGDEVYVETRDETIIAMSKNHSALEQPPTGELVGICKISQLLFERIIDYANAKFATSLKVDYETDALVSVAQSYPIYYTVMPDLLWAEIDDTQHLARAKEQIYRQGKWQD